MTTEINLNIVNFIGLKVDKKTVNINQPDAARQKRQDKASPAYRTIDVTPHKHVISGKDHAVDNIRKVQAVVDNQPEVLTCYPVNNENYVSKAYSSKWFFPKGTHIDSYV